MLYGVVMPLLRATFLSDEEHRDLLVQAGFVEVATRHLPGKNWIFATGRRPSIRSTSSMSFERASELGCRTASCSS